MTSSYTQVAQPAEIPQRINELGAKTVVIDIEPLVAFWDTDQATLQAGVAELLDQITATTAVQAIVFATNSARTLPTIPAVPGLHIDYLASARKPFSIAAYHDLPKPGVVIGDQTATDGVLAWRLGYAFLHYCPNLPDIPTGPRLMGYLGRPIHALLFHPA